MHHRTVTAARLILSLAAVATVWSCGKDTDQTTPPDSNPAQFPGVDENEANLTPLATACAFVADGGVVSISMAAGEYSLIGKNATGAITVNGTACGAATATNTTRINVVGPSDGGSETVILDYINGSFAAGTASAPGINIDLKNGTDAVKIRGTSGVDQVLLATSAADAGTSGVYSVGLGLNGTAATGIKNITFNNVESLVVSTGPGDDVISTNGQADAGIGGNPFGVAASGTGPSLVIYGGDNNDTVKYGTAKGGSTTFNGGLGTDSADFSSRTTNLSCTIGGGAVCGQSGEAATIATDVEVFSSGSGDDTLACDSATACTLNGNAGNDSLTGGSGADSLNGGVGDDTIQPGTGDDTVVGGAGTDTVTYAERSADITVVLGTAGAASTSNGDPALTEDDSIATCENVIGGAGADTITGNELDNQITGGAGDDTLTGGAGNDTFFMSASKLACGDDTIDGQGGEDTVSYAGRSVALTLTLNGSTPTTGNGESGENGSIVNVEDLICGSGADTVTGDANDNVLEGGGGNDTIDAAGGNDIIDPGAGTNSITCGAGNDILLPGGTTTNTANDCEG